MPVTEGVQLILQYNLRSHQHYYSDNKIYDHKLQAPSGSSNEDSILSLVKAIQEIIASGTEEVGFLLRHLYCRASIHMEYLKGANTIIYAKLSQVSDVSLILVILEEISMETEWAGQEMAVYKALENGVVGNEVQEAECCYFRGGMFIHEKRLEVQVV
ncbi:hypothetical protein ARMGADRAFT_1034784 [Armillaria gallica]|uniref:Uncharacterized protein n=1 Tax=Armillaria gallica TaxID=47427 RepID=A0A2H3DER1_ARMGA|nr:hypothetical protein ARMGADRAFT_1034784 [Armillaria gallica]